MAGQGATLGMAGAYVLADQLGRAGSVAEGLARYERLRRPVLEQKQQVARNAVRWFLPRSRVRLTIRRAALALARLPGFDRLLANALAGKHTTIITDLRHGQR